MQEAVFAVLSWVEQWGAWGILIGLVIEVIPSEIVLAYGGYLVAKGQVSFWSAVWFGTIGGTAAQLIVYAIGKYGGRPFLERFGKYVLIQKKHLDMADQWFERYGTGVIFSARFIPVVRHAISVPAGIAGMPLLRFTVLTALAVLPWTIGFVWLGMVLGEQWAAIGEEAGTYTLPVMGIALAGTLMYMGYVRKQSKKAKEATHESEITSKPAAAEPFGEKYVVFRGIALPQGESIWPIDCVAIGPNGVFVVAMNESTVYRQERMVRELIRSVRLPAEVRGIVAEKEEDALRQIRQRTARRVLDSRTIRMLADLIAERVAS